MKGSWARYHLLEEDLFGLSMPPVMALTADKECLRVSHSLGTLARFAFKNRLNLFAQRSRQLMHIVDSASIN